MIDKALYWKLTNSASVTAIFGTRIRAQTSSNRLDYPMLTYFQVDAGIEETRSLGGPVTIFRTLQQIDLWGLRRADVIDGANAVREALDGALNVDWGGFDIRACIFDQQFDGGFEEGADIFRTIQQYRVVYAA